MRVLLVPNALNPAALAACAELATWLTGQGLEPVLTLADAQAAGMPSHGVPSSEIGEPALAVALGGDGTILKAFHTLPEMEIPLLGVKFGRLGFLSGAHPENMREAVEAALAGDAGVERRATLRAEVIIAERPAGTYRALNEVVLSRGGSARVIAFDVAIDGRRLAQHRADGIVIATATGSTAYALSAGGPIVAPGYGGMIVMPVAPHTLQSRALVTGPNETVELTLPDPARSEACFVVDGDLTPCRRSIDRVTISRGTHDCVLVKLSGRDFYDTVAEEFFGG